MIFLRHPRPQVAPGICYGRLEVPEGPRAAAEIAAALARIRRVRAVRASPAARCQRLAERIATRDGCPLALDPRLAELDFGAWEGRPWEDIDRAESDPWSADPWRVAPPGGETFASLHARVAAALEDFGEGTAVVTHAGVIRAARMLRAGAGFARVFAEPVPYATPLPIPAEEDPPWPM